MDITTLLQKRLSKAETVHVAKTIGDDPVQFKTIFELSVAKDKDQSPRAAWLMDHMLHDCPWLFVPHLAKAVKEFGNLDHHNSIHRCLGKSLLRVEIPEDLQGALYDTCVSHLLSPASAIAIKAHAMELATIIALPYEELREELVEVINEMFENASAGVRSKAKRMLKQLQS